MPCWTTVINWLGDKNYSAPPIILKRNRNPLLFLTTVKNAVQNSLTLGLFSAILGRQQ